MLFGNSGQGMTDGLSVQGEKIPELEKEIKSLILKTNGQSLGLGTNLSECEAVTRKELPGNTVNFHCCWTQKVLLTNIVIFGR